MIRVARRGLLALALATASGSARSSEPLVIDSSNLHPYGTAVAWRLMPRYPKAEREAGTEGDVLLGVLIARSGELLDVQVAKGSGNRTLDRAALEAVIRAAPFPPIPGDVAADRVKVMLPIHFRVQK